MKLSPGKLWGLRRLADHQGFWRMVATDQREMFADMVAEARGVDTAPYEDVANLVSSLVTELQDDASAVLVDPIYGYLNAVEHMDPRKGLLLSYESLYFAADPGGVRMEPIPDWTVGKIRSLGADGVKVLALYRADSSAEARHHQEDFVQAAGEACVEHDIPMLLEILVYPNEGQSAEKYAAERQHIVVEAMEPFRDPRFHVDIYKLEPPGPLRDVPAPDTPAGRELAAAYHRLTDGLPAPWVLLSAGMNKADFRRSLDYAFACQASGYLAGRALWSQAPPLFPDAEAIVASLRGESRTYMQDLNATTRRAATPWFAHPAYVGGLERPYPLDRQFASHYAPVHPAGV